MELLLVISSVASHSVLFVAILSDDCFVSVGYYDVIVVILFLETKVVI